MQGLKALCLIFEETIRPQRTQFNPDLQVFAVNSASPLSFGFTADVPHKTLHQEESGADHVQGVPEVPRIPAPCFPQAEGEARGPGPR